MGISLVTIEVCVSMEHDALPNPQHVYAHLHLDTPQMHDLPIYQVTHGYEIHISPQLSIQDHLSTVLI
jgi:hypothetical protein